MSSYINSIGIANPSFKHHQNDILSFMLKDVDAIEHQKKLKAAFKASGVNTRYSVLSDFGLSTDTTLFLDAKPFVENRMQKYKEEALPLALSAIQSCINQYSSISYKDITHLITVSCTGMYAPGIDIDIINTLELPHTTARACLNFMGCNAAINALRVADTISKADKKAKILIVCVELCTLHYQASASDDFILSNTLFSDGAAAVLISQQKDKALFSIVDFYSAIYNEGSSDMCWNITSKGFEMVLSSYVPSLLNKGIEQLLQSSHMNLSKATHLAIHPGGKKILDTIRQTLEKEKEELLDSYSTLENYGNMSSATILFVLHAMLNNQNVKSNNNIMALSFGPGLTIEGMNLQKI